MIEDLETLNAPSGVVLDEDWQTVVRSCCDCLDRFQPRYEHQIRCAPCNAWKRAA